MSYNSPPSNGPEGQWYDDYGIPAYHEQGSKRLQKNRAPQQEYVQYQQQYAADPRMRFPRPQAYPRAQQMDTRDLYDDTDYADYETDQWPLSAQPVPRQEPPPRRPNGSRPPPRPQRPDYVPPNVEPPRSGPRAAPANHSSQQPPMQQPPRSHQPPNPRSQLPSQQFHHGTGQWTGEGYSIPTQASGLSSHGNPIPQQAIYTKMPPRPPLGPPPSSRRGPSSYYSQQLSPVHPIVEEAESSRHSHSRSSLTSSNAIPIGIPKFYLDGRESGVSVTPESENAPANSPPRPEPPLRPFKQRMQEAVADDYFAQQRGESPSEGNVPVRQASLGRRSKPTLTHVKSGDRMRKRSSSSADVGLSVQDQDQQAMPTGPRQTTEINDNAVVGADYDESPTAPPMPPIHRAGATDPGDSFFDSSSGSGRSTQARGAQMDSPAASVSVINKSDEHLGLPKKQQQQQHHVHGRSPLAHDDDDDDDDDDDAFAKETFTDPEKRRDLARKDSDTLKAPTDGFSGLRAGKRRPPRLNVDAIKDEEARGSLTSLSDLIKRATRLASNLDRGRTASRLGMEHFLAAGNGEGNEKTRRSAASLSDILNSFPPPGVATPQGENRSLNNWGSRRQSAPLPSNSDVASNTRKQRRCCGIPLWLFILLVIILILLVAAATVIPIVLIVIPNQNSESSSNNQASTGTQASTLSQCSESLTCENGGQAFPSSESEDTCRCVCVNSFTGPTCSTKSTAGCSSLTIPDMDDDATVGDAIPRLVNMADDEYSIPLDARAILGLFNEADLSCAAENALVSFNGKAQRRLRRELPSVPTPIKRSPQASEPSVHPAEATSNGIVFDSRPSPVEHSVSPASATTTSSPSPSASSSSKPDLDFARAAVLYILQDSASLQDAEGAQKALQQAFDAGKGAGVVAVGGGEWQVDLGKKVLKKGGEQVGGDGQ